MIPSNDCLTAINTFPIVAKREVNKEWRTGTEDTNPKFKWQLRSLPHGKTNIQGNYVLRSPRLTGWMNTLERDQGSQWKQLVTWGPRLWKLHLVWTQHPWQVESASGVTCSARRDIVGLASSFEFLGNKPRFGLNVL